MKMNVEKKLFLLRLSVAAAIFCFASHKKTLLMECYFAESNFRPISSLSVMICTLAKCAMKFPPSQSHHLSFFYFAFLLHCVIGFCKAFRSVYQDFPFSAFEAYKMRSKIIKIHLINLFGSKHGKLAKNENEMERNMFIRSIQSFL